MGTAYQVGRKTLEEIAEDLEEELSEVKRIYDVVVKYLSEYDSEKILAELNGEYK